MEHPEIISLETLKEHGVCKGRYKHLIKGLGGIEKYGMTTPISLMQIYEICGIEDVLWAIGEYDLDISHPEVKELQEIVLTSKDAEQCCYFAKHIEGADIERLQEVVLASKDAGWCYCFAIDVAGADIKRLQEIVITSKDAGWCYYFARYIEGADKKKLMKVYKGE